MPRIAAAPAATECAQHLLRVVPPLMRDIRSEMRAAAPTGLSVPQFRILIYANVQRDPSVTEVAQHLGVSVPTASVAIDKLVRLGMLRVQPTPENRRRRSIALTPKGAKAVAHAMDATTAAFAQRLAQLPANELKRIDDAMQLLEAHGLAAQPAPARPR
jgi:MarR family transcriptional regulator for hemolysin